MWRSCLYTLPMNVSMVTTTNMYFEIWGQPLHVRGVRAPKNAFKLTDHWQSKYGHHKLELFIVAVWIKLDKTSFKTFLTVLKTNASFFFFLFDQVYFILASLKPYICNLESVFLKKRYWKIYLGYKYYIMKTNYIIT